MIAPETQDASWCRETRSSWIVWLVGLVLLVSGVAALPGCEDPPNHAQIVISAGSSSVTDELDSVVVTITASGSATGFELCEPYTVSYSLRSEDATAVDLPFTLEIVPGPRYDQLVVVRVEGKLGSEVRFRSERAASLSAGPVEIPVALFECLHIGLEPGEHCVDGTAEPSPYARIFNEGLNVQSGSSCRADD